MIQMKLFPEGVQEKDVWAVYDEQFEKLGYNVSPRDAWEFWITKHIHRAKKMYLHSDYYIGIIWKKGREIS